MTERINHTCFFCSQPIIEKKTLEHIIPNSLLGKLGIKEQTVTSKDEIQYSRIKVPAHSKCNSEFGSIYEDTIIKLLDNPDQLYEALRQEEIGMMIQYGPDQSVTQLISTWLSKIFYGLFYNDSLKSQDDDWRNISKEIVSSENFKIVQTSYQNNHGFCLPSSLFVFKTTNENFDLKTLIYPQGILLKIKSLVLVLVIADGFLTKNYIQGDNLTSLHEYMGKVEHEQPDFPVHNLALAEILALRLAIKKSPSFIVANDEILNMSFSTSVNNPQEYYKVDEEEINEYRTQILSEFGIQN
ncbi:hypothetical protein [Flavobacterium sp. HJJ]|uniref:hypothetical protein n=1 Tax=Flavobacterium sp. HJJ TaxID=2783792 RepID=UPI00188DBF21|nr:hypothetical protein [Flavobacterium sp. HJJ]MBF4472697.1 hypothetical protein [Flavobacterium sp. HJJ]